MEEVWWILKIDVVESKKQSVGNQQRNKSWTCHMTWWHEKEYDALSTSQSIIWLVTANKSLLYDKLNSLLCMKFYIECPLVTLWIKAPWIQNPLD